MCMILIDEKTKNLKLLKRIFKHFGGRFFEELENHLADVAIKIAVFMECIYGIVSHKK